MPLGSRISQGGNFGHRLTECAAECSSTYIEASGRDGLVDGLVSGLAVSLTVGPNLSNIDMLR
ncbi:hypothetical protein ADK54_11130 [Streptomyces sp. WM6378]|nr:hypothetical protein ADK54_11130 [Streptomyces sp. WM6378]